MADFKYADKDMQAQTEMPQYLCHKKVWALKITAVDPIAETGGAKLTVEPADRYAPIEVDQDYVAKHAPFAGGYYVVYEDGYKSFSPAAAFEAGYELINK